MTPFTEDTWIAELDHPRFQVLESECPGRYRAKDGVLTSYAESSCCVVFSGVLYNRNEIDLIPPPGGASNDAARVLRAYVHDGDGFISKMRGIYSFLLWDSRSTTLLAARDPLGIFPLFYARPSPRRWLFSPTLGALLAHAAVSTRLDATVLAERLFDHWVEGEETEYEAVRRLLPGHVLTICRQDVRTSRYWNPVPADLRIRHRQGMEDRFGRLFDKAVGRSLAQGKAGIFLSGGVDSISVASVATRLAASSRGELPIALSLLYTDSDANEEPIQRQVATSLGLHARQVPLQEAIGKRTATQALLEANATWPVPMINLWLPAFLALAQEGEELGCQVILTGGGGDEWLGVSPYLAADLIRSLRVMAYYRFCRQILLSYDIGYRNLLRTFGWSYGVKPHLVRLRDRAAAVAHVDVDRRRSGRLVPGWVAPGTSLRETIRERCVIAARRDRARRAAAPTFYDYEARRTLDHPIVVSEIENKFHLGQRAGVRMLEPYWDAELVELLYSTSPDDLSLGGLAKGLIHGLVQRALPELPTIRQRKTALSAFYREQVRREGHEAWATMKGVPALAGLGVVDPAEVERKVQMLLAGNSNEVWLVPYILSAEAWVRAHG